MRRGKGASVVNVASAAGLTSTGTGAVYAKTKAAMVRACAVRVNSREGATLGYECVKASCKFYGNYVSSSSALQRRDF